MDCYRAQRRWRKVEELWQRAGRGVADRRARRRGPHRLRRRARRPGPAARGARPAAQAGRAGRRRRRSTTCASGTRSPTSRSGPATSPAPASCSTRCAGPIPRSPTSPSASPRSADGGADADASDCPSRSRRPVRREPWRACAVETFGCSRDGGSASRERTPGAPSRSPTARRVASTARRPSSTRRPTIVARCSCASGCGGSRGAGHAAVRIERELTHRCSTGTPGSCRAVARPRRLGAYRVDLRCEPTRRAALLARLWRILELASVPARSTSSWCRRCVARGLADPRCSSGAGPTRPRRLAADEPSHPRRRSARPPRSLPRTAAADPDRRPRGEAMSSTDRRPPASTSAWSAGRARPRRRSGSSSRAPGSPPSPCAVPPAPTRRARHVGARSPSGTRPPGSRRSRPATRSSSSAGCAGASTSARAASAPGSTSRPSSIGRARDRRRIDAALRRALAALEAARMTRRDGRMNTRAPVPSRMRGECRRYRSMTQHNSASAHEPTQRGEGRVTATPETSSLEPEVLDEVVIRFAGDSGDGMQLTGDRFTDVSAVFGNDLATMPNYPAEIRAPAGTIAGVSSFQVHISDHDIVTPGDAPNVLVAMNPAALKANLAELPPGSTILVNSDAFDERNLAKVGYDANPLDDGSLAAYHVVQVPMTSLTLEACKELGVKPRDAERSKNFFALGLISWMYTRPVDPTLEWIEQKFGVAPAWCATPTSPRSRPACTSARPPSCSSTYQIQPAKLRARSLPQHHRQPRGRVRAHRRRAAGEPADPLRVVPDHAGVRHPPRALEAQELRRAHAAGRRRDRRRRRRDRRRVRRPARRHRHERSRASTSSPRRSASRSASSCRCVLVDVQRGGPSTGLPTKTEQSDLLLAMYGRHGESPLPIVAAYSPSHCFDAAFEAVRIALKYRTPVILLTDGYVANGVGAVDAPRRRRAARHLGAVRDRAEPRRRVLAVPPRPRDARPPVGDPGHARAHAPHRRHREAGRHRQRQLRPREPRAHDPHPGRQGGAASPTTSRRSRSTATPTPRCSCSGGGARGARSARRCAGCAPPAPRSAHAHLVHLNPFPAEPRRGARARTRRCSCPR